MTVRLCLDLNVFVADLIARRLGRKGTAASMLVEALTSGVCPAGPVQLVTSVPIIENWANGLRRHFGCDHRAAEEVAWILQAYAVDGPIGLAPQMVVGSGFVPFESEIEMRQAIRAQAARAARQALRRDHRRSLRASIRFVWTGVHPGDGRFPRFHAGTGDPARP